MSRRQQPHRPNLGRCCICEGKKEVRTLVALNKKAPVPGTGWGCLQCGLALDGAQAVICDECAKLGEDVYVCIRWACYGCPMTRRRMPVIELLGTHEHNMALHPECSGPTTEPEKGLSL